MATAGETRTICKKYQKDKRGCSSFAALSRRRWLEKHCKFVRPGLCTAGPLTWRRGLIHLQQLGFSCFRLLSIFLPLKELGKVLRLGSPPCELQHLQETSNKNTIGFGRCCYATISEIHDEARRQVQRLIPLGHTKIHVGCSRDVDCQARSCPGSRGKPPP